MKGITEMRYPGEQARPAPENRRGAARRAIRLAAALAALTAVALAIIGCGGVGDDQSPTGADATQAIHPGHAETPAHAADASHATGEPLGAPTDFSLYHLDAIWTDQHGAPRQLSSLAGRVQVIAMVYTTCAHACPQILADMKRIEGALPEEAKDRVGFVMVTIDPTRDTPEQLAAYARDVRLDSERWTLLTAPDNTVLEMAALLGVKYRKISETDFSHTNVITILDQSGEIVHRQVGLGADPGATLRVIEQLL